MSQHLLKKSRIDRQGLYGLFPDEIAEHLSLDARYRGRQVYDWLLKGVNTYNDMLNVPKAIRARAEEITGRSPFTSHISHRQIDSDGTVKLLVELADGHNIECVLLTDEEGRKTACVSSQAGCAMGCAFCRTAGMGLIRNLTAAEIVEQYYHLAAVSGKPSHIVFMGMGEPLANIHQLFRAILLFHDPGGLNISARKMTISTCGMVDGIEAMADDLGIPVKLAVSLTSTLDSQRDILMPVNKTYPLEKLRGAIAYYNKNVGKRVTLEYVLLGGENDSREDCARLISFADGLDVVVNVIPWNPAANLDFTEPTQQAVSAFCSSLEQAGVRVTRRYRRGRGINGACGQLAGNKN